VDWKIVVWILVVLHNLHPVNELNFINYGHDSWSVAREVVEGGVVGHCINAFIFAGLNDLNNLVVARFL
jgi:hypothetical protein